jgi:hypothetical protein
LPLSSIVRRVSALMRSRSMKKLSAARNATLINRTMSATSRASAQRIWISSPTRVSPAWTYCHPEDVARNLTPWCAIPSSTQSVLRGSVTRWPSLPTGNPPKSPAWAHFSLAVGVFKWVQWAYSW